MARGGACGERTSSSIDLLLQVGVLVAVGAGEEVARSRRCRRFVGELSSDAAASASMAASGDRRIGCACLRLGVGIGEQLAVKPGDVDARLRRLGGECRLDPRMKLADFRVQRERRPTLPASPERARRICPRAISPAHARDQTPDRSALVFSEMYPRHCSTILGLMSSSLFSLMNGSLSSSVPDFELAT